MSKEESALYAKFRKRSKANYAKVKETEAKAGGRELPLGLEEAVCQITGMKLGEDKNGVASIYIYRSGTEPKQIEGIAMGQNYPCEETHYNYGSGTQTEEENQSRLISDLKLMGYEEVILTHDDFWTMISDVGERIEQDAPFVFFNTGKKASNSGEARIFLQEVVPPDNVAPTLDAENQHPETHTAAPKKTVVKKGSDFDEGDKVTTINDFFGDGEAYTGVVVGLDGDEISVEFDDGSGLQAVPSESLELIAPKRQAPTKKAAPKKGIPVKGTAKPKFDEGDRVVSANDHFENGEDYQGMITTINQGAKTCTVTWDNGDTDDDYPLGDLKPGE